MKKEKYKGKRRTRKSKVEKTAGKGNEEMKTEERGNQERMESRKRTEKRMGRGGKMRVDEG